MLGLIGRERCLSGFQKSAWFFATAVCFFSLFFFSFFFLFFCFKAISLARFDLPLYP